MQIRFVLFVVALASVKTHAEVLVTESIEHYLIAPKSEQDIKLQLRTFSPISKNNQTFHGRTRLQLEPYFRLHRSGNLCRIIQISVRLHTTYTMPKIDPTLDVSDAVRAKFDQYYAALTEHEKGHHQLGIEAAHAIRYLLENQTPHFDCRQLKQAVQENIQDKLMIYQQKQRDYDVRTGYGRSQGAVIR